MNPNSVKVGLYVKIVKLGDTKGMFIKQQYLDVRQVGVTGIITGYVSGHGGDVWWIKHDGADQVGAYAFDEFEKV